MIGLARIAEQRRGMLTTAMAEEIGVARNTLSRMAARGALSRVAQGVYRVAGAPELDPEQERIYATWLALGGAGALVDGVPPVVVAGEAAAIVHELGDFYLQRLDVMAPSRRTTRLPDVRVRTRALDAGDVRWVDGLPVLSVEATIADLVEQWTDMSLVGDVVRDAIESGRLTSAADLVQRLGPLAATRGHGPGDGVGLAQGLFDLAGVEPSGWVAAR